jgi:hypothetical protein
MRISNSKIKKSKSNNYSWAIGAGPGRGQLIQKLVFDKLGNCGVPLRRTFTVLGLRFWGAINLF